MAARQEETQLLQLPDPCLLVVLQNCADDLHSLFSAARAHSRLHQAAVQALSSITVSGIQQQQQVDGLLRYLSKYGHQVDSMDLTCSRFDRIRLCQLPDHLHLSSLKLAHPELQLQPGSGVQGVVRPGVPLKQLQLQDCKLVDGAEGLAAALSVLPGLQHLSFSAVSWRLHYGCVFLTSALSALQQLTHLELLGVEVQGPDQGGLALQPLQYLTQLKDLRLYLAAAAAIDSSMLSGLQCLARLELTGQATLRPGALGTLAQLQHLYLEHGRRFAQLLPELQHLQQLTHLHLRCWVPEDDEEDGTPAAAFAALTASSMLQHLDISRCMLPAGVWQHVFPASRQLPHLKGLEISDVREPSGNPASAPEGTRLVSCCPGLQSLDMQHLRHSAKLLVPLQGLSGLRTLLLTSGETIGEGQEGLEAVCQLKGLRQLTLHAPRKAEGLLLKLAQLKQLTRLDFTGSVSSMQRSWCFQQLAADDEPVWRQILWHPLPPDPEVMQQAAAAAALAE